MYVEAEYDCQFQKRETTYSQLFYGAISNLSKRIVEIKMPLSSLATSTKGSKILVNFEFTTFHIIEIKVTIWYNCYDFQIIFGVNNSTTSLALLLVSIL